MAITHLPKSHKKRSFHSGAIHVYRCSICNTEQSVPAGQGSIRCKTCEANGKLSWMSFHEIIQERKTDEIRNRIGGKTETYTPGKVEDMWEEGLIKMNVKATVYPIAGTGTLEITANKNKTMWTNKVIEINGGYYRLNDLGAALKEML